MALGTIRSKYVRLDIAKLPGDRSPSGNPRDFKLGERVLRWAPSINRDKLMANMKTFEAVPAEVLNPSWADQEVSRPENIRFALVVNRVKDADEVWKLEIDAEQGLVVSAEIAAGSPW